MCTGELLECSCVDVVLDLRSRPVVFRGKLHDVGNLSKLSNWNMVNGGGSFCQRAVHKLCGWHVVIHDRSCFQRHMYQLCIWHMVTDIRHYDVAAVP